MNKLKKILSVDSSDEAIQSHTDYVAAHPAGSLQQTAAWGKYQNSFPDRRWEGVFTLSSKEGDLFTASIVSQSLPKGFTYLMVQRGFLISNDYKPSDLKCFIRELRLLYPKALFIRFDPPVTHDSTHGKAYLESMKDVRAVLSSTETTPTTTLLIDLNLSEDEVLSQMHPKGRYNIKVAKKHDVVCSTGTMDSIDDIYPIFQETADRTGISIHSIEVYKNMLEHLGEYCSLEIARAEGVPISAMINTSFASKTTYYYGASRHEYRKLMAPYLIQWHAITKAKANGDNWYDFLGIAPPDSKDHPLQGVTDFKRKFGGIVRQEVKPYEIQLKPFLTKAFKVAKKIIRRK